MFLRPIISSRYINNVFFILLLFIVTGSAVYFNCLHNPFQFDDTITVVENVNIRQLKNIPVFFTDTKLSAYLPQLGGHYRPLVVVSYAVNFAIAGLSPVTYHITNLIFHIGSSFLVFLIVKALLVSSQQSAVSCKQNLLFTANGLAAIMAGLIFLLHPFNSEAVNYITARSSIMSGFFYLLGFLCWVKYRQGGAYFYIASLLAFIAGMLSKEVAVTLPVMFWLYDMYGLNEISSKKSVGKSADYLLNWRTYIPYVPFVLIVLLPYLIMRLFSFGNVLPHFQRDMVTQIFTEVPVLIRHWQMFIIPKGFSLIHDVWIYNSITPFLLVNTLILLSLFFLIFFFTFSGKRLFRMVAFFLLWFFVVLLPTTIIPLNDIFQENRGYLAIVSFSILAGIVLLEFSKRMKLLAVIVSIILLVVYGPITIHRNMVWGNDITLWQDAIAKAPESPLSYAGLSGALRKIGDIEGSLEIAKKGVHIDPEDLNIRANLAIDYHLLNKKDEAIKEYVKALRIAPERADIWNELATVYISKDDFPKAEYCLKEGIKAWGGLPQLHYNLGGILAAQNRFTEAVDEFKKAIALRPQYTVAYYELGKAYEAIGRGEDAKEQYLNIKKINYDLLSPGKTGFDDAKTAKDKVIDDVNRRLGNITNNAKQ